MERWNQKGKELKEAVASETAAAEQKKAAHAAAQQAAHAAGVNAVPLGGKPQQVASPVEAPSPSEVWRWCGDVACVGVDAVVMFVVGVDL